MARTSQKQKLFNGRDHSWMQFNRRVLEEAEDPANPLLERVKFLAITASNLDEYVEVRQAGLMQRIEDGYREPGYDGLRPEESLTALTADIHSFVTAQYSCWNDHLLPELRKQGIRLLEWDELSQDTRHFACSSTGVCWKRPKTPTNPLLERVKFLAITGSNLDEYVEVRQAGLMQRIEDGYREPGYDGLRPDESLADADRRDPRALWPRSTAAGTSSCCPSCASRASGCWSGRN